MTHQLQTRIPANLIVFEMANNHMGDIEHGLHVIRSFGEVGRKYPEFNFAFKLQYRDLDSFIHPLKKGRDDVPYVKRFSETRLTLQQFDLLIDEMRAQGFYVMSTPFDNASVKVIEKQNLDIIKIASCSVTDWPLLEEIAATDRPIIASTAGATIDDIDQVVSFFSHRNKDFAILHCVGEYPTADEKMHLGQIDYLKARYPDVRIGFSTHENPGNFEIVKMAIAKGATIFEKHVGVATDKYALNAYSISPAQADEWLKNARYARNVCGLSTDRAPVNEAEVKSLRSLRRGVFLKHDIEPGQPVTSNDVYFAFPPDDGQYTANDWSKYAHFRSTEKILRDQPLTQKNAERRDDRTLVRRLAKDVKQLLDSSQITIPGGVDLEISHHYGIDKFYQFGLTMLTVVNRGYCKKILVSLPNQVHPEQYHLQKEETFHILYGEIHLKLNGELRICRRGDVINIEPGVRHEFVSPTGAVFEEISSTHFVDDSFYSDSSISQNKARKTFLTYWMSA